jgi:glycosyltransferase involved in cell wall biosynthesis
MKLLVLTQYFWPEGFRINDVVRFCVEKGFDVQVLTAKPNYPEGTVFEGYRAAGCSRESWEGVKVNRVPIIPRGKSGGFRLTANYLSFILSGLIFGPWLLRKQVVDVIFVYAPSPLLQAIPALWLAWLKRCPVVLWVQDLWPESLEATGYVRNPMALRFVAWWIRFIYRHTDLILAQSRAFEPSIRALAPGKIVAYYPNSVDEAFIQPVGGPIPALPALDDGFSILFAGNVGAAQAMEVIAGAAEMLKDYVDIHFVVVGEGSRWQWLHQQVQLRELTNLHLPGRFPVEAMPGVMLRASVLLVTLTNQPIFAMTVPAKIQAYLAVGRPIIACLNGEGARLVEEAGAGIAVAAGDTRGLVRAILEMRAMPREKRFELGENGRRYYSQHFNHEKLMAELIHYLESVIVEYGDRT